MSQLSPKQQAVRTELCRSTTRHLIEADEHRLNAKKAISESNYHQAAAELRQEIRSLTQAAGILILIGDTDLRGSTSKLPSRRLKAEPDTTATAGPTLSEGGGI